MQKTKTTFFDNNKACFLVQVKNILGLDISALQKIVLLAIYLTVYVDNKQTIDVSFLSTVTCLTEQTIKKEINALQEKNMLPLTTFSNQLAIISSVNATSFGDNEIANYSNTLLTKKNLKKSFLTLVFYNILSFLFTDKHQKLPFQYA